jgi:hypothetical protein
MTQQFREGQHVEVHMYVMLRDPAGTIREWWEPAKIFRGPALIAGEFYEIQFPDGARRVFGKAHIRAAPFENSGLNEELQKHEAKREIESKSFIGRKGENPSWE